MRIPSLIYQMKFANLSLAKHRDLDMKVNALIKKLTKFPNSFPTARITPGADIPGQGAWRLELQTTF